MNDRELLELAAKACGVGPVIGFAAEACELMIGPRNRMRYWKPLTDDGDALRLAVKLRIDLNFFLGFYEVHAAHCMMEGDNKIEHLGGDDYAAARRAIVRAAAVLGEQMP